MTAFGAPLQSRYQEWFKYEAITPDSSSLHTILRQTTEVKFGLFNTDKPFLVGQVLESWASDDIREKNEFLEDFIVDSALRFVAEPPYIFTTLPNKSPVPTEVIVDGYSSKEYVTPTNWTARQIDVFQNLDYIDL